MKTIFRVLLPLMMSALVAAAELLPYGDFERPNLSDWSETGNAVLVQDVVYAGTQAARIGNGDLRAVVSTVAGQTYRVTGWVRILAETGTDWGGFRVSVSDFASWTELENTGALLTSTHGSDWFRVSLTFEALANASRLQIGYFGGSGRQMTVYVDDFSIVLFDANEPPVISSASLVPQTLNSLPGTQTFSVTASDPDGTIAFIHWDFGDGSQAATAIGSRPVSAPGSFTARVTVYDDNGASAFQEFPWTAADPAWPTLSLSAPADESTTALSNITVSGTASAGHLLISSDRHHQRDQSVNGAFTATMPLEPGWNRLLVQLRDANGRLTTQERRVRYLPSAPLAVTNLVLSTNTVPRWDPLEIRFDVLGSAATHREHPWTPEPPPGLDFLDGISADAYFSADGGQTEIRRPAYWHQPYLREQRSGREWMEPTTGAGWRVRFAPPTTGSWQVAIEVREAKGTVRSAPAFFTVVAPGPSNRGPVRVSAADPRYFETADGQPFHGAGHGGGMGADAYSYDLEDQLAAMGAGNQDFLRVWIAGHLWGSAWQPWASRTLAYDGTVPPTGLSYERRYGDGFVAWRLDAANPLLFQGFQSGHAALVPGTSYRVGVRWKTEGVTGPADDAFPHGLCLKFTGWPEPGQTATLPVLVPHVAGDAPWHWAEADFTATDYFLPNLAMILENTTDGSGYVDEISVREVLPGGALGPERLRGPRANAHLTFDPRRGAGLDHALTAAQAQGVYLRLVIAEKQDWVLDRLGPAATPAPNGEQFYAAPGTAGAFLHESYWRHLFARFGAFRSVHSWELVNEAAPGDGPHFALTTRLAERARADANPHPASISTWATLPAATWNNPDYAAIDHADFHAYVRNTGWLEPREALANDSARLFNVYDLDARARVPGKPIIWGEMGIDGPTTTDEEDEDIALDTSGVWLHKMTWARCGPGGIIPLYWWPDHIFSHTLHGIYGAWKRFMDDIPLANGNYADAAATTSHADLRVMGQKDQLNGRAHLWIDNARHTWRRVVDGETITPVSGTVRIPLGTAQAAVQVDFYATATGLQTHQETLATDSQGDLVLALTNLATDVAVKLLVTGGGTSEPSSDDWLQHQRDAARTGRTAEGVAPPYRARWIWAGPTHTLRNRDSQAGWTDDLTARPGHSYSNLPANSGASFAWSVQPVVAAGRIFVGSMEGIAYAVSTENGGTLWQTALPGPTVASAAVAGQHVIFVCVSGDVAAYDVVNGALVWRYDAGRAITAAPVLIDDLLLVGTQAGHVHALNPSNGVPVWVSPRLGPSIQGGLAAGEGRVFVGTEDMVMHALDLADGTPLAQRQVRGQSFRMLWPVLHGGRVWVSTVTTPIIGSEYVGESNEGSYLFADSPTLAEEETNILRWLDGDTNGGRWPDAGADWRRLFALNVNDLSEPFIIPAAPVDGCGVPPHPPIVDGEGRLLTYFKTRYPALTVANGGVFGTQFSVDIAAIHPDTGRRVPLDDGPLANPWPWEVDNLYALSSAGNQLWLRQNFRGTLMLDLDARTTHGVSAEIRNRDGGLFNFDIVYRDSGSPVGRPQPVPLGRAAPAIVDGRVYILEDWGLTAIEHRP
jgi:outer membrane protein assembly factor BamB